MLRKILLLSCLCCLISACGFDGDKTTDQSKKNRMAASNYNVQLGVAYLRQGDVQRAKRKLLLALEQAPQWAPAQDAMGYFLMQTGDAEGAEKYFQAALAIDPKNGAANNNYGSFLCRNKRYAEAEQHFLTAVHDPSYVNMADAYENAGLCALEIPDVDKAEKYLQKASLEDPNRASTFYDLCKLYFNKEDYNKANDYLARYWKLTPANAESLWLGRQIAMKLGYKDAAATDAMLLRTKFPHAKETQMLEQRDQQLPLKVGIASRVSDVQSEVKSN